MANGWFCNQHASRRLGSLLLRGAVGFGGCAEAGYCQGSPGLPPANPGRLTPRTYFPFDGFGSANFGMRNCVRMRVYSCVYS